MLDRFDIDFIAKYTAFLLNGLEELLFRSEIEENEAFINFSQNISAKVLKTL